jgi:hypothetical protein
MPLPNITPLQYLYWHRPHIRFFGSTAASANESNRATV